MSFENNALNNILHDRKIAILATDGFDESQLFSPKKALEAAGAEVIIVSTYKGKIKSWAHDHWGKSIEVDITLNECNTEEFDGLLIPGGEINPETLLRDKDVSNFVKEFLYDGKSVASICHGIKVLLDSGLAKGKTITLWENLKNDNVNSGVKWKDDEVVTDKGIITTRCPVENQKFNRKMIEEFAIAPRNKRSLIH